MEYRDHEIYARTHVSGNRLWTLTEDGHLDSCEFEMFHDDDEVVWYEVEAIDPKLGMTIMYTDLQTLEDAKSVVDASIEWCKENIEGYDDET